MRAYRLLPEPLAVYATVIEQPVQRPGSTEAIPVVFVSSHSQRGGSERYLAILLEQLDPAWVQCVVCLQSGPFVDDLRAAGHPTEVIETGARPAAQLASARRLRSLLRRSGAAVVHANGIKAAVVAVLATRRSGIPVVWFKHDVSHDGWLARAVAARCSAVVAASSAVTATFSDAQRKKVHVVDHQIPEPRVDPDEARRRVLDALAADEPVTVVALVGRLDPLKGHRELLELAPALLESVPTLRFLFVGGDDPSHREHAGRLRREVGERRLDHAVVFTGHRNDAAALIAGSDLLAVPSVTDRRGLGAEAGPYVALEALALGTPVVGYAQGALPERLGESGILVPMRDRPALAEAIVRLARDEGLRARLAASGRRRFEQRFRLGTLASKVTEHYRRAARTARP